jgi:hypothetical protein
VPRVERAVDDEPVVGVDLALHGVAFYPHDVGGELVPDEPVVEVDVALDVVGGGGGEAGRDPAEVEVGYEKWTPSTEGFSIPSGGIHDGEVTPADLH